MDNQDDKVLSRKEQAKDVVKTLAGMLNYTDGTYDPDLTLDEFEEYYKNQLKKAKPENKKEIEELINLVSILKKQQEIVDREMKLGDFNALSKTTAKDGGKGAKTKDEVAHQVKKAKEKVVELESEEEKKKKKKKAKRLKEQADLEIQNLGNEQERTINNEED